MSGTRSSWQRVFSIAFTLIVMLALVVPTAVEANKAPAPQAARSIEGKVYEARFVGQTNGTAANIAERLYGPSRGINEQMSPKAASSTNIYKPQVGSWKLPWAKSKPRTFRFPNFSGFGAETTSGDRANEDRKKVFDDVPSPDLYSWWEGLNQGSNRTLFGYGVFPPDTTGDTSGDVYSYGYYVQTVNTVMAVWDYGQNNVSGYWPKTVLGPMPINQLWEGTATACEMTNDGDPIVRYDEQADRWLISQFALPAFNYHPYTGDPLYPDTFGYPFSECVAISKTGDPTGEYWLYEFVAPLTGVDDDEDQGTPQVSGAKMPDYPKFGVWQDGYYMSVNQFDEINFNWGGAGLYVFQRSEMLNGDPASMIYFDPFSDADCSMENLYSTETDPACFLGGMLPADNDGDWANFGGGEDGYFMQFNEDAWSTPAFPTTDSLEVWRVFADWGGSPTLYQDFILPVAAFDSDLCGYNGACIQQPGTTQRLDALSDRLMDRLEYRPIDRASEYGPTYEVMVTNHAVDVNGADRAGVRWYELRRDWDGFAWSSWYVYQYGTYSPDTDSRWMGSMAVDAVGNLALGYSVSSALTHPTIRYTTHMVGDALGTMRDEDTITSAASAAGSQTGYDQYGRGRWGDYSSMTVASGSGCDFVYTNEYLRGTTGAEWYTRMGNFGFDNCFDNDVEGPLLAWDDTPGNTSGYRDGTFDWYTDYENVGTDYYECRMDAGAWFTAGCDESYDFSGLSTGWHTFYVRGVDSLGNVGDVLDYTWEITAQTVTYYSVAAEDGHIYETSEISGLGGAPNTSGLFIQVGDYYTNRQAKGFLSFASSVPGGAIITNARIQYRRYTNVGTDPYLALGGDMLVDLASAFFGASAALGADDFAALETETAVAACPNALYSGAWYACMIDPGSFGYFTGPVQFRLYFPFDDANDTANHLLQIYSGNYAGTAYDPMLIIDYYIP